MSCAIAIRATKARVPRSTSLVDDLGVGNRRTGGGGVSLRPGRARREGSRLVPRPFVYVAPTDAHATRAILASTSLGPQQCRPRGRRCPLHYGRDDEHGAVRGFRSVHREKPPSLPIRLLGDGILCHSMCRDG